MNISITQQFPVRIIRKYPTKEIDFLEMSTGFYLNSFASLCYVDSNFFAESHLFSS
jgi:hypothetical protein